MSTTASPAAGDQPVTVPLRDVEHELSRQLKGLHDHDETPVQRVRMSNLVIFCNRREVVDEVAKQLPAIAAVHPARVLLLIGEEGTDAADITAAVQVQSQMVGRLQVCSEQVTLHAAGAAVHRLPFAVRALLVGDLPTNLWWSSNQPPPLAGPFLYELAEQAQQIIYDSIGWPDPPRGVAATGSWLEQIERRNGHDCSWRVASDLNWRRLKYWRRVCAQALEPASAPGAAESITELLIEHGPHAVIQAWELTSWLAQRLEWQVQGGKVQSGQELGWKFRAPPGDVRVRIRRLDSGAPAIRRARFACKLDGKPGALNLVAEDGQRLAIVPEGVEAEPRTIAIPPQSAAELVGRQLSDRAPDPVFRQSMAVAEVLAQSLLAG
jgi:glucose-6-phosphate dehydrogenase assembly protein OpcA